MADNATSNIIDEITVLRTKYNDKWGVSVFEQSLPLMLGTPINMIELRTVLEHIIDTGETVLEGYEKYILGRKIALDDVLKALHFKSLNKTTRKKEIIKNRHSDT